MLPAPARRPCRSYGPSPPFLSPCFYKHAGPIGPEPAHARTGCGSMTFEYAAGRRIKSTSGSVAATPAYGRGQRQYGDLRLRPQGQQAPFKVPGSRFLVAVSFGRREPISSPPRASDTRHVEHGTLNLEQTVNW